MKVNLLFVCFCFYFFIVSEKIYSSGSHSNLNSIPVNTKVLPSEYNQVQTSVATSPVNNQIIAAASITDRYPGGYTTGAYFSTNGGATWTGTNAIKRQNGSIISTVGDPTIITDKNGNHIIAYTAPPSSGNNFNVGVCYSTNNGVYWSEPYFVTGVGKADKVTCTTDNSSSSPYYGNVYMVYSDFIYMGLYFSTSTNSGATWDEVKRISPPFYDARVGASIVTGKQGEIYVSWPFYDAVSQNNFVGFGKSTDGGITWTYDDMVVLVNSVRIAHKVYINGIRANGLPYLKIDQSGTQRDGTLYIVCTEKDTIGSPALDDYDILIHSSTDQGDSWNPAKRVNQDNTGSLKYQFYSAFIIDDKGGIDVVYYDSRNTPTNDSFQVYLSRSVDGGNTFEDILISDHKFRLSYIQPYLFGIPGYIGTYIGITSSGNSITPVWFDNSEGKYQVWTATVNFGAEITYIPEGLYDAEIGRLNRVDTVTFYLRKSTAPFNKIDSSISLLDSVNFKAEVNFMNAPSGEYYIQVDHWNSMSIWSNTALFYSPSNEFHYDFTTSKNQAYGGMLTSVNGKWCAYAGDINRDQVIDMIDVNKVYNDMSLFLEEYSVSDVNGDGVIELYDLNIIFNNGSRLIEYVAP